MLMNLALTIQMATTFADPTAPKPNEDAGIFSPIDYLEGQVRDGTNYPSATAGTDHPDTFSVKPGISTAVTPIYFAIDFFRFVISGIAVVIILMSSIRLIQTDNDEEAKKNKDQLVLSVIGLFVIQLADVAVKKIFFGETGDAFSDQVTAQAYAEEGVRQLRGVIGFIHLFLGGAAVLTIVIRGFTLIYSSGSEEELGNAKRHIIYATIGMAVVGLSEVIVRGFIFPDAGTRLPDIAVGRQIAVAITNYISSFVAIIAFGALFYAGYRYVMSGGNEEVNETVKKIVLGAMVALLMAAAAFAFVNTFITLDQTVTSDPEATLRTLFAMSRI